LGLFKDDLNSPAAFLMHQNATYVSIRYILKSACERQRELNSQEFAGGIPSQFTRFLVRIRFATNTQSELAPTTISGRFSGIPPTVEYKLSLLAFG